MTLPQTTPTDPQTTIVQTLLQAIHWMGNQAQTIAAAAGQLQQQLAGEASVQPDLETILRQAQELAKARERLLGAGQPLFLRPALLPDVVQAAAFFAGVPDDKLTITAAPDTPFVLTDTTRLAGILGALFQNALEANATHLSANITPTLDRAHVAVSIADDGEGIPAENREKIWAAFFTTKDPGHTGLGLAAARLALFQMGGRVALDSEPGKGATFTLVLPTAPDDEAIDLSHAPQNIFFVDEATDAWALFAANVLKLAGKNVVVQESPAGAAHADLILVDEALTTMPVEEVIADLNEAGVAGRAVVVTAALDPTRAERYMKAGVKDVALKPYTYQGLAAFLRFET